MDDPARLNQVRQQMLQEGFSQEDITRAFRDVEALTATHTGTPPSFLSRLGTGVTQFTAGLKQQKTDIPARVKADLLAAGVSEEVAAFESQKIARNLRVLPETPSQLLAASVPLLVGKVVPAGRTMPRILGQLFGNIAGSAALQGGEAALTGEEVLPATVEGAVRGVPGGVLQAVTGGLLGPNKTTIKAAKSLEGLASSFSPGVAAVVRQKTAGLTTPKALFSRETSAAIQEAAGRTLDVMESTLRDRLGDRRFQFPPGTGPKSLIVTPGGPAGALKVPFQDIRDEIKRIRNIGDRAFADPEKQFKAKQLAARIENGLLTQLDAQGLTQEAGLYRRAISQFAQDRGILRALNAVQRAQALPGGLNRADSPIVAAAIDILKDPGLSPSARAAAMSVLAASGHPFMALHFSGLGRAGGVLDPNKIRPPLGGPRAGLFGSLAGAAGSQVIPPEPDSSAP